MQIFKLSMEKMDFIMKIIDKIITYYSKSEQIEAIYMICFNSKKNMIDELEIRDDYIDPAININLIFNNYNFTSDWYDFSSELYKVKQLTGIDILLTKSLRDDYGIGYHHREIVACKNLVNGSILFDRDNQYHKLKEKLESYCFFKYYEDLIQFETAVEQSKKK